MEGYYPKYPATISHPLPAPPLNFKGLPGVNGQDMIRPFARYAKEEKQNGN